jgi:nucleoside-triphosphate--adenylate kinase
MEQAEALAENVDVDLVVDLNVPNETIVERIADRYIHPASGRVYNLSYNPPKVPGKDDETGEDLVQRDDDKPETVRKRLEAYEEVTAPLVQYYNEKGVLKSFSGTESDVIYPQVNNWLEDQLYSKL